MDRRHVLLGLSGAAAPLLLRSANAYGQHAFNHAIPSGSVAWDSIASPSPPPPSGPAYPLKLSASRRYLVDQHNVPYQMSGESGQALLFNLSPTDNITATDAGVLWRARQAQGMNCNWAHIFASSIINGRSDFSTYDGIVPFPTNNLGSPNVAYFARVDAHIALAAKYGFMLLLNPLEHYATSFPSSNILTNSGLAGCAAYGTFLGNRYKNTPNIMWVFGNDYSNFTTSDGMATTYDQYYIACVNALKAADPNHFVSVEFNPGILPTDNSSWSPVVNLNVAYCYSPTYSELLRGYNHTTALPVFMGEGCYEQEGNGTIGGAIATTHLLRAQAWWSNLSGAIGHLYGTRLTWPFSAGWETTLNQPGANQMLFVSQFFATRAWWNLVPDQSHLFVTSGFGTLQGSNVAIDNAPFDYVTAGVTADGTLGVAYLPQSVPITVDVTKMAAPTTARWYDPTNGTYTAIPSSPIANTGPHTFTTHGLNSSNDPDWVLVLEPVSF